MMFSMIHRIRNTSFPPYPSIIYAYSIPYSILRSVVRQKWPQPVPALGTIRTRSSKFVKFCVVSSVIFDHFNHSLLFYFYCFYIIRRVPKQSEFFLYFTSKNQIIQLFNHYLPIIYFYRSCISVGRRRFIFFCGDKKRWCCRREPIVYYGM